MKACPRFAKVFRAIAHTLASNYWRHSLTVLANGVKTWRLDDGEHPSPFMRKSQFVVNKSGPRAQRIIRE